MSLHQDILSNINGFSKAKFSTWFYYRPDGLLFDLGEGASIALGNGLFGIDIILLSHGHGDHIGGLPGFLRSRATSMGDNSKPLQIYYPARDVPIRQMRDYLEVSLKYVPFLLEWFPLEEESEISLKASTRKVRSFYTNHVPNSQTMGFNLTEKRTRLKAEYRTLSQKELMQQIQILGKEQVMEEYEKNLLTYSGDAMPVDPEKIFQTEVLLHDATFLREADRDMPTHATVDEVFDTAQAAQVKSLVLYHISSRYFKSEVEAYIREVAEERQVNFEVYYFFPRFPNYHFLPIYPQHEKSRANQLNV